VDRMSATDAGFFHAEDENTPMHVGSVSVFEGPAPSYGDLVRLLLAKLPLVPRYRQRVRSVPLHLGRPLWVDDEHFQILYHVRHTAVPRPGGREQLRNLAGRVLGQRLDMSKPLWEVWLVEGLEDGRWALILKVHHCMVDGVAGTDLMQLVFDASPDAEHGEPQDWTPQRNPSTLGVVAGAVQDAALRPTRHLLAARGSGGAVSAAVGAAKGALRTGRGLGSAMPTLARQLTTPVARTLNGPIGPHRRWAWTDTQLAEVKRARAALGGTVNDVVLAAVTRGFRDLLQGRGALSRRVVVRSMVPVSVRTEAERGSLNNKISAVFVDLPVAEPDPRARLASIREQMDHHKSVLQDLDTRSMLAMADLSSAALLELSVRAGVRTGQSYAQAVTTNIPGPRIPLYVLGRRMVDLHAYVPVAGGIRIAIGIFSYLDAMTFGINADFDAFPDVDVLAGGIDAGMDELCALSSEPGARAAT
jgi:diacylglycerol O-acyltransferase